MFSFVSCDRVPINVGTVFSLSFPVPSFLTSSSYFAMSFVLRLSLSLSTVSLCLLLTKFDFLPSLDVKENGQLLSN